MIPHRVLILPLRPCGENFPTPTPKDESIPSFLIKEIVLRESTDVPACESSSCPGGKKRAIEFRGGGCLFSAAVPPSKVSTAGVLRKYLTSLSFITTYLSYS